MMFAELLSELLAHTYDKNLLIKHEHHSSQVIEDTYFQFNICVVAITYDLPSLLYMFMWAVRLPLLFCMCDLPPVRILIFCWAPWAAQWDAY